MRVEDLGHVDGPLLLFGGPYSNLPATRALLAQGAAVGAFMICTGDVVAYGADGAACVAALRAAGVSVVAGNVERQLAAGALDCGCGFEAGSVCDRLSAGWYAHADATIGAADRAWMAGLPDLVVLRHGQARVAVIHGGVRDVARFVWPVSEESEFAQEIEAIDQLVGHVDMVVAGHCGIAFIREVAGVTWVNAGVIGMPPHDGDKAVRYAVLDKGSAEIHRLDYDATAAFDRMQQTGLTQGYDKALLSGIWPSEDILPLEMRRLR